MEHENKRQRVAQDCASGAQSPSLAIAAAAVEEDEAVAVVSEQQEWTAEQQQAAQATQEDLDALAADPVFADAHHFAQIIQEHAVDPTDDETAGDTDHHHPWIRTLYQERRMHAARLSWDPASVAHSARRSLQRAFPVTAPSGSPFVTAAVATKRYLLTKREEALIYVRNTIVQMTVEEGGLCVNGLFCCRDGDSWLRMPLPDRTSDLQYALARFQMENCAHSPHRRGTDALSALLDRVCARLISLVDSQFDHVTAHSVKRRMTVGTQEQQNDDEVGSVLYEYRDGVGGRPVLYRYADMEANLLRMQGCALQQWLLEIAMSTPTVHEVEFDALNGMCRSGHHVLTAKELPDGGYTLGLARLCGEPMLLDAGHDLSDLPSDLPADTLAALPEVQRARALMEPWLGQHLEWFLLSICERLLLIVRKQAHVFETQSDRGKTTLLELLLMTLGSYAVRRPNDAIASENKRSVPLHELALSKAGVRFIVHDECDHVAWEALKEQANAASADMWAKGCAEEVKASCKATRILTRNSTKASSRAVSAPIDCRRKIVLWGNDCLLKPKDDPVVFKAIKNKDKTLARGVFLLMLEIFQRAKGQRCVEIPEMLLCGDDLRPSPPPMEQSTASAAAVGVPVALLAAEESIRNWVVATFHSIFRPCRQNEAMPLSLTIVREAIQATAGAPAWLPSLNDTAFLRYFLIPGQSDVPAVLTSARPNCITDETTGAVSRQPNAIPCRRR